MPAPGYLTPWRADGVDIYGALYNADGLLDLGSLRLSTHAAFRHRDPAYLTAAELKNAVPLDGHHLFLGHCFRSYGHFLLETLPTLIHLCTDPQARGLYLPWDGGPAVGKRQILDRFLAILGLDGHTVHVHGTAEILKGCFELRPRPVCINRRDGILDSDAYRAILKRVHAATRSWASPLKGERIFLARQANRIDPWLEGVAEACFQAHGFHVVYPDHLPQQAQIALMTQARVVAGYSGSQLHNAIFCKPDTVVISLGDRRALRQAIANQVMCDRIAGAASRFVAYSHDAALLTTHIHSVLAELT
jgi:capsular polysaccharide biosynthesis protein